MNSINFNDLNLEFIMNNNDDVVQILKDDIDFYFKLNIKKIKDT